MEIMSVRRGLEGHGVNGEGQGGPVAQVLHRCCTEAWSCPTIPLALLTAIVLIMVNVHTNGIAGRI